MAAKKPLPFGTWPSPVTAALAAQASRRFGTLQTLGEAVYWSQSRPEEGGRQAILRAVPGKAVEDMLPLPWSARSRVHEYGGGEFLATDGGLFFVNDKDQQVYRLGKSGAPKAITSAPGMRFADFAFDRDRDRLIAVAETHAQGGGAVHASPRNTLVAIELGGEGRITELTRGRDFYASPRLSPRGDRLAYLAWDLPDMPWDSATLYVAAVQEGGRLGRPQRIAGGDGSAVFQPEWSDSGELYFAWDKGGWGTLNRWDGRAIVRVRGIARAELWRPQWVFGSRCYALHADGRIACAYTQDGMPLIEVGKGRDKSVRYPGLAARAARIEDPAPLGRGFVALVSRPLAAPGVMRLAGERLELLGDAPPLGADAGNISVGEPLTFRRPDRQAVHAFYYPPRNVRHRGPTGARPPVLMLAHGGPTSMTDAGLKMRLQFFTSRGFAVCDVNYSGSTGYGRAYRERLEGAWGVADVIDCAAAARYLAKAGLADAGRIAIAGGSAGGYTTLMALATSDAFAAGSCHYGVSDLALLLAHTHKFESGYLHRLMGTTPGRWKELFARRSPINLIAGIKAPVILFQGLDDKVVPPEQSRLIVEELRRRGVEVAYHEFAGEGHGFRRADSIIAVLEAELAFLRRVLRLG